MTPRGWVGSRVVSTLLAGVALLGLSACGGGEGDEGCGSGCSNAGAGAALRVITATLSLTSPGGGITGNLSQGFALQSLAAVSVEWFSNPAGAVKCVKLSNGVNGPFVAVAITQISTPSFSFVPQVMPAAAGSYTGNVTLQAYSDAGCVLAIGGASLAVPYSITVL